MKIKLFLFLMFIPSVFSCNNNSKISVAGKWKPVQVDMNYIKSYGLNTEDIKSMVEKASFEFMADGKFISDSPQGSGIYQYDEKEKLLTIAGKDVKATTFSVEFTEKNKMVLSGELGKLTLIRD